MAVLTAEIQARFQQVQNQLKSTTRLVDGLEKEFKQAAQGAQVLSENTENLNNVIKKTNRSAGRSTQIWFQAGQAVSDFAVAGIRGAANNLEFLALQLGASGPVLLGITAVTVALVAFSDQISAAFNGATKELEELESKSKEVADSLIEINREFDVSFGGNLEQLEESAKQVDGVVEALQQRLEALRGARGTAQTGQVGGIITFNAASEQAERLQLTIESIEKVLARVTGIQSSLNDSIEQEKVLQEVIAELEDTSLEKTVEKTKEKRKELTELEKQQKTNEKLKEQLDALRDTQSSILGQIISENDQLREQIKIVKRLNEARERDQIITGSSLGGFQSLGPLGATSEATPIGDVVEGLRRRDRERSRQLLQARDLDPDLVDEVNESLQRQEEQARDTRNEIENLSDSINQGLAGAFSGFIEGLAAGGDPFTVLREQIGSFAVDVGQTLIGFGLSGEAIKNFIVTPGAAIIAGAGLVALGTALKRSVKGKTDSFVATGTSGGDSGPSFVDPRQARDGRFRRNFSASESGFSPINDFSAMPPLEFTFGIRGEDLVAVSDKNERRQSRTRGSSPARSMVGTRTSR